MSTNINIFLAVHVTTATYWFTPINSNVQFLNSDNKKESKSLEGKMGFTQNPYSAYQKTAVKTASQGQLIVLLYDGAEKELAAAENCFGENGKIPAKKVESFGKHILKAQDIINELQVSLDMEKGGQIAQNLMSLYVFFNKELMNVNIAQDKAKLGSILNMIKELGSAWKEAATHTDLAPQRAQQTLNITG